MKNRKGYLFKRGKTFYACWIVGKKKYRKSTGQTNEKDANKVLADIIKPYLVEDEVRTLETVKARIEGAKAELADLEDKQNPPLTIMQAWPSYVASPNRFDSGERTLRDYSGYMYRFTDWLKKEKPAVVHLRDVTKEVAEDYAADLHSDGLSAGSFNKHRDFLKLAFDVLKDKARMTLNPWADIQRKKPKPHSRRELTTDELKRVCQSAEGEMRLLFALGIYTGLRLGDCSTLKWGEVDLRRTRITRIPNKTAYNQKPVIIPLHPVLAGMLSEIPASERGEYVMPKTARLYLTNAPQLTRNIQDHFKANKINTVKHGTGDDTGKRAVVEVGFHSLRHTFVSLCREANAPLSVVEAIVGHSNPAMTRHYTHVSELAAGQAVAALPSVMTDAPALPASNPLADLQAKVKAWGEQLTAKTWKAIREEMKATAKDFPIV
jgi:integrase